MAMRVTGESSRDLQDRLVQFITREQPVNRATPFCKETELDRLHDACLEPAYEDIATVLNHYRKMSRQFRMREAAGDQISPFVDVPSALQSQQQRPVAVNPVYTSALPSSTYFSASRAASSPSAEFQPGPSQWPKNPPPSSVWRSQECGYVEQVNQQHKLEQQQQYRTLQPASTTSQGYVPSPRQAAFLHLPSQPPQQQISGPWQLTPQQPVQGPPPPPLSAQQSQHNVTQHSLNISAVHDEHFKKETHKFDYTGIVAGTIRADINPEKLVVCVDQGHEDNGEEALDLILEASGKSCVVEEGLLIFCLQLI
ncbi:uncharacterized protein [Pseudochaenichthys georgianus]|uniref:uncharacterized protein n=1 Tax=Pseudochaenichthys georgianus TaxID=52239 RepID=UPI0039C3F291